MTESQSYDDAYPAQEWAYLRTGIMVEFDDGVLVHYPGEPEDFIRLGSSET